MHHNVVIKVTVDITRILGEEMETVGSRHVKIGHSTPVIQECRGPGPAPVYQVELKSDRTGTEPSGDDLMCDKGRG